VSNSKARHAAILQEAAELFEMKNSSYKDSWRDQGWRGNISRLLEKSKRVRSLLWRPSVLMNGSKEHPRETLLDIINTCVFAIINIDDSVEYGEGVDDKPIEPPTYLTNTDWVPDVISQNWPEMVPQENANEVTLANIPVPGEEPPSPKPRNRKVTDRGSGPRKAVDAP
jgi:hypothetical protein